MSQLSSKQLEAISAILKGLAPGQIAKLVGVSTRTLERWRKLPEFAAAISRIQENASRKVEVELVKDATNLSCRLERLASKSLDTLEQILDNPEVRTSDRVQAAKLLLTEWQRAQPPVIDEFAALGTLITAGYLPHEYLLKFKESLDNFTDQTRTLFAGTVNRDRVSHPHENEP